MSDGNGIEKSARTVDESDGITGENVVRMWRVSEIEISEQPIYSHIEPGVAHILIDATCDPNGKYGIAIGEVG